MPVMKLTPAVAMRARDVSRPHDEHVAEAEAAQAAEDELRKQATGRRPGRGRRPGPGARPTPAS